MIDIFCLFLHLCKGVCADLRKLFHIVFQTFDRVFLREFRRDLSKLLSIVGNVILVDGNSHRVPVAETVCLVAAEVRWIQIDPRII